MRVHACARRLRSVARLQPGSGLEAVSSELGVCAMDIVAAALEAAGNLQDSLLSRNALGAGPGTPSVLRMLLRLGTAATGLIHGSLASSHDTVHGVHTAWWGGRCVCCQVHGWFP